MKTKVKVGKGVHDIERWLVTFLWGPMGPLYGGRSDVTDVLSDRVYSDLAWAINRIEDERRQAFALVLFMTSNRKTAWDALNRARKKETTDMVTIVNLAGIAVTTVAELKATARMMHMLTRT